MSEPRTIVIDIPPPPGPTPEQRRVAELREQRLRLQEAWIAYQQHLMREEENRAALERARADAEFREWQFRERMAAWDRAYHAQERARPWWSPRRWRYEFEQRRRSAS